MESWHRKFNRRVAYGLDLSGLLHRMANTKAQMRVSSATAFFSNRFRRLLQLFRQDLVTEMNSRREDFEYCEYEATHTKADPSRNRPALTSTKTISALELVRSIDSLIPLQETFDTGIDALNGKRKDGTGKKVSRYISYKNGNELKKMRNVIRYVDLLGAKVKRTPGLTLKNNHLPKLGERFSRDSMPYHYRNETNSWSSYLCW